VATIQELQTRGERHVGHGEFARALECFEQARTQAQATDDSTALSALLGLIGEVHVDLGQYDDAVDSFKTALELDQAGQDHLGLVEMNRRLGSVFHEKGDVARAKDAFRDAERRLDGLEPSAARDRERALIQIGWATIYEEQGQFAKALEQLRSALGIHEGRADRPAAIAALRRIAGVLHEQGDGEAAEEHLDRADALIEQCPEDERDVSEQIEITLLRGAVLEDAGRASEALEAYRLALARAEAAKATPLRALSLRHIGSAYAARGDFADAIERYQQAIDLCKRVEDDVALSELYGDLGDVYREQGAFANAEQEYKRALALDHAHQDKLGMAVLQRRLGHVHQEQGELEQADDAYKEATRLLEDSDDATEKAKLALRVGSLYEERGRYQKALESYERAEGISRDQRAWLGVATALRHVGSAKQQLGDLGEAERALRRCLELLAEQGGEDRPETIEATNLLGSVLEDMGKSAEALDHYQTAMQLAEALSLAPARAESLRRMGSAYAMRGEIGQAIDRFSQAIDICRKSEDPVALSQLYGDLGDALAAQGSLNDALDAYKQALRLDQRQHDDLGIAVTHRRLGAVFQRKGDHDRAEDAYREAKQLHDSFDDDGELAVLLSSWGSLYEDQGHYHRAIERYEQALGKNEQQSHAIGTAICLRHLASALLRLGDVTDARERAARARELMRSCGNEHKPELIELHCVVARVHLAERRPEEARLEVDAALRLADDLQLGPARIRCLRVAGKVAMRSDRTGIAIDRFTQARDLCRSLEDAVMEAELLDDLADALLEDGQVDKAMEAYNSGLKRARRLDRHALTADILLGLARCSRAQRKLDSVHSLLDEASEVVDRFDASARLKAHLTLQLARLNEDEGREDAAISAYEKALDELRRGNDVDGALECHSLLLRAYARLDRHEKAAIHLSEVLASRDPGALWSAVLNRLHPTLTDPCRGAMHEGRWATAATEAFKQFEHRLRRVSGTAETRTPATQVIRDWFTPERRGEQPFEPGRLPALAGFAGGAMSLCRNRHVHQEIEMRPDEAFAWIGVAHLLLEYLEEPAPVEL
jgi:tetratricopeptide (TPR) repeat protein